MPCLSDGGETEPLGEMGPPTSISHDDQNRGVLGKIAPGDQLPDQGAVDLFNFVRPSQQPRVDAQFANRSP